MDGTGELDPRDEVSAGESRETTCACCDTLSAIYVFWLHVNVSVIP